MLSGSPPAAAGQPKPIVLVVDDTPGEIQVLGHMLLARDHDVRFALNGADALAAVAGERPDIIMLDIEMPGLDGYEVCRRIKGNDATADIPIIFVSAMDRAVDKVQAFDAGGADYVDKPFQVEEVLARVQHQLRITRLQREMADANRKLKELEQLKAMFAAMLVHDLRSPLTVIHTTLQILHAERHFASKEDESLVDLSAASMSTVLDLINDVLHIYQSDAHDAATPLQPLDVAPLLARCGEQARVLGLPRQIPVDTAIAPDLPPVMGNESRLDRVVMNLLTNAVKFSATGALVRLSARGVAGAAGQPGTLEIAVSDRGSGIAETDLPFVFEPYRQAGAARLPGVGLGLTIAKRFVEMHSGTLTVESQLGAGATFTIRIPALPA
ncbi:MAG TPA: hybrid sensor histidine kinase/response regulator [Polyangia bacterium]|nr:hybrid sensor histidine kinase/response regulator [Polyangia bacterium]